jgi:hypothetical protein
MIFAIINNLPELALGLCWTSMVWILRGKWDRRKSFLKF